MTSVIKSRLIILIAFGALIFPCIFNSCESFFPGKEKPSKNLIIENEVEVATESVSPSGGTIIVNDPSSEIDGMEIMVPEGSYSNSRTFKITTATITNHNLGEYFNPITPLIQIENGSGYSDSIMEITIPISIEDGEIPLGFYYDEITGKLEAIPVKDYTNNSITLLTRHFMPASELRGDNEGLKGIKIDATSNLVISSLAESIINMKAIISSGFKIGEDNWEFVNMGSYIAPGGHCAGQNLGAAWYYFEKKLKGEANLWERFSTIPGKDFDNAIGYRFCSVLQQDYATEDGFIRNFSWKYIDKEQNLDKMKWYTIAGAMLTTGEPQLVAIYRTIDNDNDGVPDTYSDGEIKYGGHSIICYQISVKDGKLYICDPNYPQTGQVVEYDNNTNQFKPYNGKANGGASSYFYKYITWNAKTALIDWPQISKRYKELSDSTIGNVDPNTFPDYTIWTSNADGEVIESLTDGMSIDYDTVKFIVECPDAEIGWALDGRSLITFTINDEKGETISNLKGKGINSVKLKPGLNKLGFYIYSQKNNAFYMSGVKKVYYDKYIDYKWFNVYYSKLKIDPDPIVGEPDKDIEITAISEGTAPKDAKYVWNFGDGTKEVTVKNDSIVKHKFPKEGDFEVVLDMYDNSTNKIVGHAFAEANIANGILSRLQRFQWVEIMFAAEEQNTNSEYIDFSVLWVDNSPPWGVKTGYPIKWNGASFSVSYDYQYEDFQGESSFQNGTFNCTMSANGLMVKTFEAHETSSNNVFKTTDYADIIVTDIPYNPDYEYDDYNPRFEIRGSKISSHVASYSQKMVDSESSIVSTTLEYSDDEEGNYIIITFSGEK